MSFEDMVMQALITIFIGVILYLAYKIIDKYAIEPYYDFKREAIETVIDLQFHSNILTNAFTHTRFPTEFSKKVHNCQERIRERWSKLSVKYEIVPKWIFSSWIPTRQDMNTIESNLLYLSNRTILYLAGRNMPTDCGESAMMLNEIQKLLRKTIASSSKSRKKKIVHS